MDTKETLIQLINQSPEFLIEEVLNFVLFLREKYDTDELTSAEKIAIAAAQAAYEAGDYISLEEYEAQTV